MSGPEERDAHVILHASLAAGLAIVVSTVLAFTIPEIFNRHSTEADLTIWPLLIGTIAFAYFAGRHLWRSFNSTGDTE